MISQYSVALFHLVNHAFFKALLFLAAGSVIHGIIDNQDLRRLGGLLNYIPFAYVSLVIGSLSLIAIPFLTGFYSKDNILEITAGCYTISGWIGYWIGTFSAFLTAFYSFRLLSITFWSTPSASQMNYKKSPEPTIFVYLPLIVLSLFSILFGWIAKDLWIGPGTDFLSISLLQTPSHVSIIEAEWLPNLLKFLPVGLSLLGAGGAIYYTNNQITKNFSTGLRIIWIFLMNKWEWDRLMTNFFILPGLNLSSRLNKNLDRGIIEIFGPYGLTMTIPSSAKLVAQADTGLVTSYALILILGILVILGLLVSPILFGSGLISWTDGNLILLSIIGILVTTQSK